MTAPRTRTRPAPSRLKAAGRTPEPPPAEKALRSANPDPEPAVQPRAGEGSLPPGAHVIIREVAAPAVPDPTRICALCGTRQSVRAMGWFGTSMACLDEAGCAGRAATSDLYPQAEPEEALASFTAYQGAAGRTDAFEHELAMLRADRQLDPVTPTTIQPA
jgi:hypothetical protein